MTIESNRDDVERESQAGRPSERDAERAASPASGSPAPSEEEELYEEEEAPRNPFDNPLFLPVLLLGLTLWFGYDAFLNDDPEMREHLTFNRVGFAILLPLLLYFGYRARQEIRASRDETAAD